MLQLQRILQQQESDEKVLPNEIQEALASEKENASNPKAMNHIKEDHMNSTSSMPCYNARPLLFESLRHHGGGNIRG